MKYLIAVIGSAAGERIQENLNIARIIAKEIAKRNAILCTGACGGLPHEAAVEAKKYGGLTIGFSPAHNRKEHVEGYGFPDDSDIIIFTGFGLKGRNVINLRSCDAVIAIAGRIGTLNELTIAHDEKKLIGILTDTGDLSNEFAPLLTKTSKPGGKVITDSDPDRLIQKVFEELDYVV